MKQLSFVLSLLITLLLVGCSMSEEELTKTTLVETENAFDSKRMEANENTKLFSYYLPEEYTVKETNTYNVLLEKDKKSYILFVNENEEDDSKVSYETLADQYKKPFISETFEDESRFGYLFVNKLGKNIYEVTVGIGGTKLTTETKASELEEDARSMMDIVRSVQ